MRLRFAFASSHRCASLHPGVGELGETLRRHRFNEEMAQSVQGGLRELWSAITPSYLGALVGVTDRT